MYKFTINKEKCINCGICADICRLARVYQFTDGHIEAVYKEKCWECGQCIAACPKAAIEYNAAAASENTKKTSQQINDDGSLIEFFRTRRSVRIFKDEPVSKKVLEELLDCTRWIPAAQNKCDVSWVCIDSKKKIQALSGKAVETLQKTAKILKNPALKPLVRIVLGKNKYKQAADNISSFENLAERYERGEDPIFYNAPVLLLTTTPSGSYFGKENSIYAGYNLMLYAAQKGLSTCRIGYFDVAMEINRSLQDIALGEESGRKIWTAIVLGYSKYKFYNLVDRKLIDVSWNNILK